MMESKLIDILGLKSIGGRLVNLDEGCNHKERRSMYIDKLSVLHDYYKHSFKL